MSDPIESLRSAGINVEDIPADKVEVFKQLTDEELSVLLSVRDRLSGDVRAHSEEIDVIGGVLF